MPKNIGIKTVVAGLLLLGGSVAFAQQFQDHNHLVVGVYQVRNVDKFCLLIEKGPKKLASVQLLTESGIELYGSALPKNSVKFSQKFDMTNLENGKYILRVRQGHQVISKSIELSRTLPNDLLSARTVSLVN
ncbi:hypothetical protein [Dyadobacter frigoris]|uniref:T9SS type A sorting domain-containing protein n=1 Tax=Dyadobacter frigoris TaxID=2576211 RepID=A0A4U6CWW7_9BACT|nr:hypothetical protein [Dyadobacter frigoris]TKT89350.1 hypothetical protein FDK13_23655 [Dyadobacter frigoris]